MPQGIRQPVHSLYRRHRRERLILAGCQSASGRRTDREPPSGHHAREGSSKDQSEESDYRKEGSAPVRTLRMCLRSAEGRFNSGHAHQPERALHIPSYLFCPGRRPESRDGLRIDKLVMSIKKSAIQSEDRFQIMKNRRSDPPGRKRGPSLICRMEGVSGETERGDAPTGEKACSRSGAPDRIGVSEQERRSWDELGIRRPVQRLDEFR